MKAFRAVAAKSSALAALMLLAACSSNGNTMGREVEPTPLPLSKPSPAPSPDHENKSCLLEPLAASAAKKTVGSKDVFESNVKAMLVAIATEAGDLEIKDCEREINETIERRIRIRCSVGECEFVPSNERRGN